MFSCCGPGGAPAGNTGDSALADAALETACMQLGYQVSLIDRAGEFLNPRTYNNNRIQYIGPEEWTSGFFPGSLWQLYELTGDPKWEHYARSYTEELECIRHFNGHHDIGFMINCSYGNAYRLTGNPAYAEVMVDAANALCTRFRPEAGIIQSWNAEEGWVAEKGWTCPVIIDNMMNLELLFEAYKLTDDERYRRIALSHADTTMKYGYRDDYSSYHVVDYNPRGGILGRHTAQGYADESSWARGQAWGLYGWVLCYRETGDKKYLRMAERVCDMILSHPNMPDDLVPYWDYDAPDIPHQPRDASAAAIMASALYELDTYVPGYRKTADRIVASLCGDAYKAIVGTNGNFILMHSVGSIPHGHEVDAPISYADYYFLEALKRKKGSR